VQVDKPQSPVDPDVSVVVATHGGRDSLTTAVRSILAQSYPGSLECVVIFDQEDPYDVGVEPGDGRSLRLLKNNGTPGAAGARNYGVSMSQGAFVSFCDDDDEWLEDKTTKQVRALQASSGGKVATCGIRIVHGGREFERVPMDDQVTSGDLLGSRSMGVHLSTFFMPREVFTSEVGPFDEAIPGSYGEDYDWLLRAVQLGSLVAVREPLVVVKWGSSRFSDRWATIIAGVTYLLEKHPELQQGPNNVARMYGRLAFAHAALGQRHSAWLWAGRALKSDRRQLRAYLAVLVSTRLIPAGTVVATLNRFGKGI
jgi:glycosyltransferase involved in cell wall biosynthesis